MYPKDLGKHYAREEARGTLALTLALSPRRGDLAGTPREPPDAFCADIGVGPSKSTRRVPGATAPMPSPGLFMVPAHARRREPISRTPHRGAGDPRVPGPPHPPIMASVRPCRSGSFRFRLCSMRWFHLNHRGTANTEQGDVRTPQAGPPMQFMQVFALCLCVSVVHLSWLRLRRAAFPCKLQSV